MIAGQIYIGSRVISQPKVRRRHGPQRRRRAPPTAPAPPRHYCRRYLYVFERYCCGACDLLCYSCTGRSRAFHRTRSKRDWAADDTAAAAQNGGSASSEGGGSEGGGSGDNGSGGSSGSVHGAEARPVRLRDHGDAVLRAGGPQLEMRGGVDTGHHVARRLPLRPQGRPGVHGGVWKEVGVRRDGDVCPSGEILWTPIDGRCGYATGRKTGRQAGRQASGQTGGHTGKQVKQPAK